MNYEEVLKQVLTDIESADVPSEMRNFAFEEGVKLYIRGSQSIAGGERVSNPVPTTALESGSSTMAKLETPTSDLLAKIATETGADREAVEQVFYVDDEGEPRFNYTSRRLGRNKADRSRTIALLMASVRYYGLDETEISLEIVREACSTMNAYDSANFTAYMRTVPGFTLVGPSNRRMLRPRGEAAAKFREKLTELTSTGSSS